MPIGRRPFPARRALVTATGIGALAGGLAAAGGFAQGGDDGAADGERAAVPRNQAVAVVGPDVVVLSFTDVSNNGGPSGGFLGYAIGTRSCNRGDAPLNWCSDWTASHCAGGAGVEDHPVIAQNLYRLENGRFEQIGMSWLKHGFQSTNSATDGCNGASGTGGCTPATPEGSAVLRIGCTDPYSAYLNGRQPLARRSETNATTGTFAYPPSSPDGPYTVFDERIKVATSDVDPLLHPAATFWGEGQYFASDDGGAGNGLNNASYQQVAIGSGPSYAMSLAAGTFVEGQPAINAWKAQDPTVSLIAVDLPGSPVERYQVARKVTDLGNNLWHYEYALRNHNSDRSARALTVAFPAAATFSAIGFKAIEHHSGEPYATTDWSVSTTATAVSWFTDTFAVNQDANALRFATMFNFWFDADQPPGDNVVNTLELFKPGSPSSVPFYRFNELFINGFEGGSTIAWSGAS